MTVSRDSSTPGWNVERKATLWRGFFPKTGKPVSDPQGLTPGLRTLQFRFYQMMMRSSGLTYILSPSFTPKAS